MNSKNICKFVSNVMDTNLNINCFILETNPEIMMLKYKSVGNRMVLVTKGKGYFNIDREYYEYEKGTLIFIFEGETYSVNFLEETEYMYVDFTGIRAEELFRRFSIRSLNRNFKGFEGLIPLWQESLSRANEKTIDLAAESTLLYTFSRLFGSVAEKNDPVNKAIEITEENFTNTELSITSVANELGYNPKYLSHLFKEKMNVGFTEYLRKLRLKQAIFLLDRGLDSIKNIASLSGFSDPFYFSTVFKKEMGISPKEYIAKIIKEGEA